MRIYYAYSGNELIGVLYITMSYIEKLKAISRLHGQLSIAKRTHMSQSNLHRIMFNGSIPRADKLLALSEILEMDLKELVTELTEQSKINENRKNQ